MSIAKSKQSGKNFESYVELANEYYNSRGIAFVWRNPVDWCVMRDGSGRIARAYPREKAILDYSGILDGKYFEFDAKSTIKDIFPLANIKKHQVNRIKNLLEFGCDAFILVSLSGKYYRLDYQRIISKPMSVKPEEMVEVGQKYQCALDYLRIVK